MSIYKLARAASNLFLLITHNFQVVWPTQRLAPHGVCSEGCYDCLLFIYPTPPLPTFTSPPIQFSMNNQTAPEKPDLVVCSVFMQIPTQRTKHTQTECNVACKHTHTHTHKVHLHSLSANMLQPHKQTIQRCIIKHKYALQDAHGHACLHSLNHTAKCAHTHIVANINISIQDASANKLCFWFWNQMYYLMYVRQFHDVNSHSAGCLLHYEGRDPADRPIPSMQQFYIHSVFFYTTGRPGSPWLSKAAQDKQN